MNEDDLPAYARILMHVHKVPLDDMDIAWRVIKDIDTDLLGELARKYGVVIPKWVSELFYIHMFRGVYHKLTPEEMEYIKAIDYKIGDKNE